MALQPDDLALWIGKELFDTDNEKIGSIVRLGYPRRRFGSAWLLVEIASGRTVLVPADQIRSSDDRLSLPYVKSYVESAPTIEQDEDLARAAERRLRLHYGLDFMVPGTACYGCGLCRANRRYQRMHAD
jgi:hypothetical protein